MFVDLHTHSTASDGAFPPEEVVRRAKSLSLAAIALTDHDSVDGVAAAQAAGAELGVRIVPGTELSAYDGEKEVHILALHLKDMGVIANKLSDLRDARRSRAEEMVARLQSAGVQITMQDILAHSGGGAIGRPHVAKALLSVGAVSTQQEAFERYIAAGKPGYVEKYRLTIPEAVEMAHQAGGVAIWAHPGHEGTRERVKEIKDQGMDGVEVRHPSHSNADAERLDVAARDFGMLRSGGSDWHGAESGMRVLGNMKIPMLWLEEQDARVK